MKVSREQMAENRKRILDAASRLFRERGFDAVTVSEVMKAAGLTHGGFYGHFASKDDLIAQAVTHALAPVEYEGGDIRAWIKSYLSPYHRERPATGCPTAGLASPLRHQSPEARAALADGMGRQIARLAKAMPMPEENEQRRAAIGSWAAMVGAVILARAVEDPDLSDEILAETGEWINGQLPGDPR